MQTVNLVQGSAAWHEHRANYKNASDTATVLSVSEYKKREQFLHELATGLKPEVSEKTQDIFNLGHIYEALARPLAEAIIQDGLSPTVGTDGEFSASFDGITFDKSVIFEHKSLNDKLRAHFGNGGDGQDLPLMYRAQMEHQIMVSGAEKCLFMASKWQKTMNETEHVYTDDDGTKHYFYFIEEQHAWYMPDLELRQQIIDGWAQFEKDLATYVPPVIVEKVEAETIKALPVPSVVVKGEITASNLGEITPMFDEYLGAINTELSTDQQFADAEANSKNCRDMATRIKALRANIIAQMVDVNAVDGVLSNYEEAFNKVGLRLEKAVKEQKETIKTNAVLKTRQAYTDHVQSLEAEIAPTRLNLPMPDFAGSFKNVKSLDTMHSRLNDALASGKIAADAMARDIRAKVFWFKQNSMDYRFLFNDLQQIIYKDDEDFKLIVKTRISDCKAEFEAKEAKIKADAEAAMLAKQAVETVTTNHIVEANKMVEVKPAILPQTMQAEFGNIFTPAIVPTQYFAGAVPTINEIVTALAIAFKVDELHAHKYLIDADFTKWDQKRKAA